MGKELDDVNTHARPLLSPLSPLSLFIFCATQSSLSAGGSDVSLTAGSRVMNVCVVWQDELTAAMSAMDSDGSGEVEYNEFLEWWVRQDPEAQRQLRLLTSLGDFDKL